MQRAKELGDAIEAFYPEARERDEINGREAAIDFVLEKTKKILGNVGFRDAFMKAIDKSIDDGFDAAHSNDSALSGIDDDKVFADAIVSGLTEQLRRNSRDTGR